MFSLYYTGRSRTFKVQIPAKKPRESNTPTDQNPRNNKGRYRTYQIKNPANLKVDR